MVKVDNENEATSRIEAALYSAGRPLSIEDLIRASGTESRVKTLNLLTKLIQKTKKIRIMKAHTQETQATMTPQKSLTFLLEGNQRFQNNIRINRNLIAFYEIHRKLRLLSRNACIRM